MKIITVLLALLMGVSLVACAAPAEFDEQTLKDGSVACVTAMQSGDFDAVIKKLSPATAAQLRSDALKKAWDDTTAPLGKFQEDGAIHFIDNKTSASVDVVSIYENAGLKSSFIYNAKGQIDGLWLKTIPAEIIAQTTDKFEEIPVRVGSGQNKLDGMLTLPKGTENPPAAILVQGSGPSDMNETIVANKPFEDFAHGLAEQGIATLRYHKRTYQYPQETKPEEITIEFEVLSDAAAAVELLKNTSGIDNQKIFVLGHSLGGMLAPKIAQDNNLAGLVCLAGSPRTLQDLILDQNKAAISSMTDKTDVQKQALLLQVQSEVQKAKDIKDTNDKSQPLGISAKYWYSLNQIDTPKIASKLSIPMFFLQGTQDFQVSAEVDFEAWQALELKNAQFQLYDGLNHLFMQSDGTKSVEEYNKKSTVSPQVIADIAEFIKSN